MKILLLCLSALVLLLACDNKYADDPSMKNLPTPAPGTASASPSPTM